MIEGFDSPQPLLFESQCISCRMKVVIINGQNHKGSTYRIARMLAEKISTDIDEFFLPRDFGQFCTGCANCIKKSETLCPHYTNLQPVTKSIDEADVLILASPVYVMHVSGPMKSFLDHYGYRFMLHRPEERMFTKQAVCIATAAGDGLKTTNKDMYDSLFYWGTGRIYTYGKIVHALSPGDVSGKTLREIDRETTALAGKIKRRAGNVKPGIMTRGYFLMMRFVQMNIIKKEADLAYWKRKGWDKKERPWK